MRLYCTERDKQTKAFAPYLHVDLGALAWDFTPNSSSSIVFASSIGFTLFHLYINQKFVGTHGFSTIAQVDIRQRKSQQCHQQRRLHAGRHLLLHHQQYNIPIQL